MAAVANDNGSLLEDVVVAPVAEVPSTPAADNVARLALPDFSTCGVFLKEMQEIKWRLQDVLSDARQIVFSALGQTHAGDLEGARKTLDKLQALTPPSEVVGPEHWTLPERRLGICESAGLRFFLEKYTATLGFLGFLEVGQLAPDVQRTWLTGIEAHDDECYLLGVIEASREIERYCIRIGRHLDLRSVRIALATVQSVEQVVMQFNFRNSNLRRSSDGIKYAVSKLEALAYEIDLAKQRNSQGDQEERPTTAENGSEELALDLQYMGETQRRYEVIDAKREEMLKRSRDVEKGAKNAIYALQRKDYKTADQYLQQCSKTATSIYTELVSYSPSLRMGGFSSAVEEFIEALAYNAFLREAKLLSLSEMQAASGLPFNLLVVEYLGGAMDLCGEVGRYAIRKASRGRASVQDIEDCLACVDAVHVCVQELPYLPGQLSKKVDMVKNTVRKIETALYEIALLSEGGQPNSLLFHDASASEHTGGD